MITLRDSDRYYIVGTTGSGKSAFIDFVLPGMNSYIIYDIDHSFKQGTPCRSMAELAKLWKSGKRQLRYIPKSYDSDEFNQFCYWILANCRRLFLIVDEAHVLTNPHYIPPYFKQIVRRGRKLRIGVISASQRPQDSHNDLKSQSQKIISFFLDSELDIKYFSRDIPGFEAVRELRGAKKYHFLVYDRAEGSITIYKPIKIG